MNKSKSLVRLVIASALLIATALFNFSVSAETKLSEPIFVETSIAIVDLDIKTESLLSQKIKNHNIYSVEYHDLVFSDVDLSKPTYYESSNLALLTHPKINEISELYKYDILDFYQDPNIKPSKNYETLKVAMISYSF